MIRNWYQSTAAVSGVIISNVTSNFPWSVHNHDSVTCKSGVQLILQHHDTVSYKKLVTKTFCLEKCLKKAQHCYDAQLEVSSYRPIKIPPHQDLPWSVSNTVLVVSCLSVFAMPWTSQLSFPTNIKPLQNTHWQMYLDCRGTTFWLKYVAMQAHHTL